MKRALAVVAPLLAAWLGSALASALVAWLEARAVVMNGTDAFAASYALVLGLLAPFSLAVGCALGISRLLLWPDSVTRRLRAWLSVDELAARAGRAVLLGLAPVLALLFVVLSARFGLAALSSSSAPPSAGVGLSLAVLIVGALLGLVLMAGVRVAERASWPPVSPVGLGAVSLALSALVFGWLVVKGTTSGAGGPFALFGVLRREELDLRPVAELALLGAGAALTALWTPPRWALLPSLAVACLPWLLLLRAARAGQEAESRFLAIERSAPLAARSLAFARRLNDRDHDGYSALFAGGDCDDHDPRRNPGADDVPGNRLDEDCSGSDAHATPASSSPAAAAIDPGAVQRSLLPAQLNTLLVTVDTLRADLGYAGNRRPLSPNLDRLANESCVFDRAYSLASYTAKSLPPMLIGRYSSETHRGFSHFNRFEPADVFLPERLQRAGVHTVSVQGHWYFFQNFGMERGFDRINSSAAPRAAQAAEGDRSSTSAALSDAVIEELRRPELAQKPWYLWVHYTDPHAEYVPHPGFDFGSGSRALYDGEVAFVDQQLGRVLDALRASPYWQNTAVVVTSDHGEAFGEHGMIRHGFELWEELVHVPLIVRLPGAAPHHVSTRRSAIDLVPSVLDWMRVSDDATSATLSGRSLLADIVPAPTATPEQRPVFVDMAEGPYNAERRAFIDGDLKLVLSGGRALGLYDLAADPDEKHDLSAERARSEPLLERYRAFRRGLHEISVRASR